MSIPLPWDVVTSKVQAALTDKVKALETIAPESLVRLQGEIATLRWVLALPGKIQTDLQIKIDAAEPGY